MVVDLAITSTLSIFSIVFIVIGFYLLGSRQDIDDNIYSLKKEPKLSILVILGYGFIYIGFLIFLYTLHIIAINTTGNTQSSIYALFKIFIPLYVSGIIFGLVAILVKLLKWMTWQATTPNWVKKNGGKE